MRSTRGSVVVVGGLNGRCWVTVADGRTNGLTHSLQRSVRSDTLHCVRPRYRRHYKDTLHRTAQHGLFAADHPSYVKRYCSRLPVPAPARLPTCAFSDTGLSSPLPMQVLDCRYFFSKLHPLKVKILHFWASVKIKEGVHMGNCLTQCTRQSSVCLVHVLRFLVCWSVSKSQRVRDL